MNTRLSGIAVLIALSFVLFSCGGGGGSSDSPQEFTVTAVADNEIDLSWTTPEAGSNPIAEYRVYRDGVEMAGTTATAYNDGGLNPSTEYCYEVSAVDTAGTESPFTDKKCATTHADETAPDTPTGLTATAISSTWVNVSWTASTDNVAVAGYNIYTDGVYNTTVSVAFFSDQGLAASTEYCYTVEAYDSSGNVSDQSDEACGTTLDVPPDTTPPSVPTGLAVAVAVNSISLSWDASTDDVAVAGYYIYNSTSGSLIASSSVTGYDHTGLAASTQYCYAVSAYDADANESAQGDELCETTLAEPDVTAPSTPAGLSAAGTSDTTVDLSWTASTDDSGAVAGYEVYRGGSFIDNSTTTAYTDSGLTASTLYRYNVKAYDASGNKSGLSADAYATTLDAPDTTAPSVPTGVTATAVSSSQIDLAWDASTDTGGSGLAGYKVYREGAFISNSALTSYSDTGVSASTPYCYTASAYDAAGNESSQSVGDGSNCATTPAPSTIETVENSADVGAYSSIAVESDGSPIHISYIDDSTDDLKYATGSAGSWTNSTILSTNSVGFYTSIALDSGGHPHVSFYNSSSGDLMYTTSASGAWAATTVDSANTVGLYTSIALDASDTVHISYFYLNSGDLKYASGTMAGGFTVEAVDSTGVVGYDTSIAVASGGVAHISYYDATNGDLKYATNASGPWVAETVDATVSDDGEFSSIALDSGGDVHISYYDRDNGALKYATGSAGSWATTNVDSAGDIGLYTSIAVDASDNVHISFYDATNGDLKYATGTMAGGFTASTKDSAGDVGQYTSIAVDSTGRVHISYYDVTNSALKYTGF